MALSDVCSRVCFRGKSRLSVLALRISACDPGAADPECPLPVANGGKADMSQRLPNKAIYEYTPFCNGRDDVKFPRVIVTTPSSTSLPFVTRSRRSGPPVRADTWLWHSCLDDALRRGSEEISRSGSQPSRWTPSGLLSLHMRPAGAQYRGQRWSRLLPHR
jgi:hypothetical protein